MNKMFSGLFGSHLYGLETTKSDRDYKSIYLPEYRDILLGRVKKNITTSTGKNDEKNSVDDVDHETFSLAEFVKLACEGQTVAIDMLHVPKSLTSITSPEWDYLVENRKLFYSKNMNAFMGYVKKQAAKYGIKGSKVAALEEILRVCDNHALGDYYSNSSSVLADVREHLPITTHCYWETKPVYGKHGEIFRISTFYNVNGSMMHDVIPLCEFRDRIQKQYNNYGKRAIEAKTNNGLDWKAISHALRAGYQLLDIYEKGDFEYPLRQTQYLRDVKAGRLDYMTNVSLELEALVEKLDVAAKNSSYPDKVAKDFWDDFVYGVYCYQINL